MGVIACQLLLFIGLFPYYHSSQWGNRGDPYQDASYSPLEDGDEWINPNSRAGTIIAFVKTISG
jgi:hypothetical protein